MKIRNTFIIFIVSGFWHGANWTFIIWGALNAIYFLPLLLTKTNRSNIGIVAQGRFFPSLKEVLSILLTFGLTVIAWIFFRAENLGHAFEYLSGIFKHPGSYFLLGIYKKYSVVLFLISIMVVIEWLGRGKQFAIQFIGNDLIQYHFIFLASIGRKIIYFFIVYMILVFGNYQEIPFIYFQF